MDILPTTRHLADAPRGSVTLAVSLLDDPPWNWCSDCGVNAVDTNCDGCLKAICFDCAFVWQDSVTLCAECLDIVIDDPPTPAEFPILDILPTTRYPSA